MRRSIAIAAVVLTSSLAQAQTIFLPVQYQFGQGANRYYYGGDNPAVFARAESRRRLDELGDHAATSERYTQAYVHRRLTGQLDRVYSDAAPNVNARIYGYLPVDAANESNANVPCHFRMADLLASAVELPDGTRAVSPYAKAADTRENRTLTTAATKPRAIIIIHKRPVRTSDKLIATAVR